MQKSFSTQVKFSTSFYPLRNGLEERTILTLEDMQRACVINFNGSCYIHLPFCEFSYNNSYHYSIGMAHFEDLHGRRCRSLVGLFEVGESSILGPDVIHEAVEEVRIIRDRLGTTYSCQKCYVDNWKRELKSEVGDQVYLNI